MAETPAPNAAGYCRWWSSAVALLLGGVVALKMNWIGWAAQAFRGHADPLELLSTPGMVVAATGVGAVLGLLLGRLTSAGWHPGFDQKLSQSPRRSGLLVVVLAIAASAMAPLLIAQPADRFDVGWLIYGLAGVGVGLIGLLMGIPAVVERGRALAAWQAERETAKPDPDQADPGMRAAIRGRAGAPITPNEERASAP